MRCLPKSNEVSWAIFGIPFPQDMSSIWLQSVNHECVLSSNPGTGFVFWIQLREFHKENRRCVLWGRSKPCTYIYLRRGWQVLIPIARSTVQRVKFRYNMAMWCITIISISLLLLTSWSLQTLIESHGHLPAAPTWQLTGTTLYSSAPHKGHR